MNFQSLAKKFKNKKRQTQDSFDVVNIMTGEVQNKEEIKILLEDGQRPIHYQVIFYEKIDKEEIGIFKKLKEYKEIQ